MSGTSDFEDIESFLPLYLSHGSEITNVTKSGTRYSFEKMRFSEMECLPYPGDDSSSDWIPDNLNQVLCFKTINQCLTKGFNTDVDGNPIKIDWNGIANLTSGFISATGSLIPQIICPWNLSDNSCILESQVTDDMILATLNKKQILWRLQDDETTLPKKIEDDSFTNKIAYHTCPVAVCPGLDSKIVSMIGPRHEYDDLSTGAFSRSFLTALPPAGAYAMLLEFDVDSTFSGFSDQFGSAEVIFHMSDNEIQGTVTDGDKVSILVSSSAETQVKVNSTGKAHGVINFNSGGLKVPFSFSIGKEAPPVLFMYSLLNKMVVTGEFSSSPGSPGKAVQCPKNPNLNLSEIATPSFAKFPKKHKNDGVNYIRLKDNKAYPIFGNQVMVKWNNCYGTFGIMPLRFCPTVKFSFFFRVAGQTDFSRTGLDSKQKEYFVLEYGVRYAELEDDNEEAATETDSNKWQHLRQIVEPVKLKYDENRQSTIYRADFEITSSLNRFQLYPFEIFSLIRVSKRSGKLTSVLNGNGNFSNDFVSNVNKDRYNNYIKNSSLDLLEDNDNYIWMKFITQASISHSLDGSSGSLTLDKQGMMSIGARPSQVIGALTLKAVNGFYNSNGKTMNGVDYTWNQQPTTDYPTLPWGQIFKGYAMEIQDSMSEGNSSLTVKLVGIQKKLEDMTLVNCPFWDGDNLFNDGSSELSVNGAVMDYMMDYSGCDLRYVKDFSDNISAGDIFLPRSSDWKSPAVNFVLGTTVKDALQTLGKYTNHRFVIQPDGIGYFYYLDEKGAPTWLNHSNNQVKMSYSLSDISSMSLSPHLENKYNTFLTLGLLGEENPSSGRMDVTGTSPGYKFSQKTVEADDYPWSRIITNKENGIVTIGELEDRHKTNVNFASATVYDGSITVPGFHAFYIFDKISVGGVKFYIIGINHNINLQNKEWTTSLQLGKYIEDN